MKMKVHYIWIGEPREQLDDIESARQLIAASPRLDISFWCNEAHVPVYSDRLPGIRVRSIEGFIAEVGSVPYRWWNWMGTREDWARRNMANVLATSMSAPAHPTRRRMIRDRVNLKVGFSLFVGYFEGGYVMDTNVGPMEGRAVELNGERQFTIPVLGAECSNMLGHYRTLNPADWAGMRCVALCPSYIDEQDLGTAIGGVQEVVVTPLPEIWMSYMPQWSREAWMGLATYLTGWNLVQQARISRKRECPDLDRYSSNCRGLGISAFVQGLVHSQDEGPCDTTPEVRFPSTWLAPVVGDFCNVDALGIRKRYQGRH